MKNYEVIIRLGLAILIGGLVGYEREFKNRPAGFRTHILVCVGAAVISMIQIYDMNFIKEQIVLQPEISSLFKVDIGRLGAQVITGVGFLGAGTILHEKGSVKGLTTAASLWVVACIGLAVGMGYYFLSVSAAVGVLLVLITLKRLETRIFDKGKVIRIEIKYKDDNLTKNVDEFFKDENIKVKNIEFNIENEDETGIKWSIYTLVIPRFMKTSGVIHRINSIKEVERVIEKKSKPI